MMENAVLGDGADMGKMSVEKRVLLVFVCECDATWEFS